MNRIKTTLLILAVFLLPVLANAKSPDFNLIDLDGNQRNVNEFIGKGKWTVVVVWAEDCPICNAEIQSYDFFHADHKDKNARVLGVTIDGKKKIQLSRDFVQRHQLSFPNLLIEPDVRQISKFGGNAFVGTPTIYVYTPDGEIVAAESGAVPIDIIENFISSWKKPAPGDT